MSFIKKLYNSLKSIFNQLLILIKYVLYVLYKPIKFKIFFIRYRIRNKKNLTTPGNYFDLNHVEVGRYTYGKINVHMWYDEYEKLKIGDFCSIAADVIFILGGNHYYCGLLTYPLGIINGIKGSEKIERYSNGEIIVGNDVWIGTGAKIMSGVNIGNGSIIAAGAIVTKDVPPYSIVGGIPAKVIKYRFKDDIIKKLNNLKYEKFSLEKLIKNYDKISNKSFNIKELDDIVY